jgi:hypothetical protein
MARSSDRRSSSTGTRSFLWQNGVNDAGYVVGISAKHVYDDGDDYWVTRLFLFTGGAMQDLNGFLPPGSNWSLTARSLDATSRARV